MGTIAWLAGHLGLNLQPLLAVGGASGIIIGLGTQQVLGNFVSGLNIFLARCGSVEVWECGGRHMWQRSAGVDMPRAMYLSMRCLLSQ